MYGRLVHTRTVCLKNPSKAYLNKWQTRPLHQTSSQLSMLDYFRRKKDKPESGEEESTEQIFSLEETTHVLTEEEVNQKRNKSRLRDYHQRLANGSPPHPEPVFWTHHTVAYKKGQYGRYGEESGVNPGLLWPTKAELENKMEYERVCNPFTIQDMVRKFSEIKAAEKRAFEQREKEIDERMKLLHKFKAELHAKQHDKEKQQLDSKERREKLMEEVKRHFGYTVDPKDEKFQEMLTKKEKEQKKAVKEARKLEKQQKMLDRLEGQSKT